MGIDHSSQSPYHLMPIPMGILKPTTALIISTMNVPLSTLANCLLAHVAVYRIRKAQ